MPVHRLLLAAAGALVLSAGAVPRASVPPQARSLDAVLAAYPGDPDVVNRTFKRSADFLEFKLNDPKQLARWLGAFDRGKAVLLLDIARVSATCAPNYTASLLAVGRRYLETVPAETAPSVAGFMQTWHHAAIGVLERVGNPIFVDAFIDAAESSKSGSAAGLPRAWLGRAVAQELRCWEQKPLEQAGEAVDEVTRMVDMTTRDLDGPRRARVAAVAEERKVCLRDAAIRYEKAAGVEATRAEARTRGAWILFQEGRHQEALDLLGTVAPSGDREVTYWSALFRGRVLDALGRPAEAARAYRAALVVYPGAQSAGVGLAVALFRSDQEREADAVARQLRTASAGTDDPWSTYLGADQRLIDRWIGELRNLIK